MVIIFVDSSSHFLYVACHTLVSIPLMVHLIEDTFGIYFSYQLAPTVSTLQLPYKEDGYGWRYISGALNVPETAYKDFSLNCIQESACLALHSLLLQEFPRCNSIEQELTISGRVVQWCSQLKPKLVLTKLKLQHMHYSP